MSLTHERKHYLADVLSFVISKFSESRSEAHPKIEVHVGLRTRVQCWIAHQRLLRNISFVPKLVLPLAKYLPSNYGLIDKTLYLSHRATNTIGTAVNIILNNDTIQESINVCFIMYNC